jgi:cytochrome b
MEKRVLVWDAPTRLFHWSLAASFAGAFLTGDSERWRDVHVLLGYTVAGLIGFRLVWGLIGTRYARFRSFLFSPREMLQYLRSLTSRSPRHYLGHNPVGSLAIFLLLALGVLTAVSGYATFNDKGGEWLEELHEAAAWAMLVVVAIHVGGVTVSSLLHRENLVRAMITGRKSGEPSQGIRRSYAWLAGCMIGAIVAFWLWYPSTQADTPQAHLLQHQQGDDDEHG